MNTLMYDGVTHEVCLLATDRSFYQQVKILYAVSEDDLLVFEAVSSEKMTCRLRQNDVPGVVI